MAQGRSDEERFWEKVDRCGPPPVDRPDLGGCWLWTGALNKGYGSVRYGGRSRQAHRVAYELLVGPIPAGLEPDHLCRVPACVRPTHLDPVTHRENVMRGTGLAAVRAAATHCVHGYPFDERNTYISRQGQRHCRRCRADRMLRYRADERQR